MTQKDRERFSVNDADCMALDAAMTKRTKLPELTKEELLKYMEWNKVSDDEIFQKEEDGESYSYIQLPKELAHRPILLAYAYTSKTDGKTYHLMTVLYAHSNGKIWIDEKEIWWKLILQPNGYGIGE